MTVAPKFKFSAFALRAKGQKTGKKDNYPTPKGLYDALDQEFHFDHDPCPLNPPGLRTVDGMGDWGLSNYVNPPYSDKRPWILKAIQEQAKGKRTVMLLPADTSTEWFHELCIPNAEIRFIRGRVSFKPGKHASYPSMLCIFHPSLGKRDYACPRCKSPKLSVLEWDPKAKAVSLYECGACGTEIPPDERAVVVRAN